MTPQDLSVRIHSFIDHNNIDIKAHSMDEIVARYFQAQISAIENAGNNLLLDFNSDMFEPCGIEFDETIITKEPNKE